MWLVPPVPRGGGAQAGVTRVSIKHRSTLVERAGLSQDMQRHSKRFMRNSENRREGNLLGIKTFDSL